MKTQRGFTLIELMVTVGVGVILSTTFFTIMSWQSTQYYTQLDNMDAHQNGRAALNIMKRYIRSARYGLAENANAMGPNYPIGMCQNDTETVASSQALCHHPAIDPNNDRIRVEFLNNDAYFVTNPNYPVNGPCVSGAGGPLPVATIDTALNPNTATPLPVNTIAGIGGYGQDGNWHNDIVTITSDKGAGDGGCLHRYAFTQIENSNTTLSAQYTASGPTNSGWSFGTATVADFFIYQDNGTPELRLRTIPGKPLSSALIVAFDIESLNISYGIDTTASPDHLVDTWCPDVQSSACITSPLTTAQNYNRIIAVKLTVGVRTDQYRKGLAGSTDGYHHYTYSTYVSLRNDPS